MRPSASHSGKQELRVTLVGGGRLVDLEVNAAASHTVGELAARTAGQIDGPDGSGFWCERRQAFLDPGLALGESGIRWGDRLLLDGGPREPTKVGGPPLVELVAGGGPCAGQRWELGRGAYTLGRDPSADIQIDDPSISRHHLDVTVDENGVTVVDAGSANGTAIDGRALAPEHLHAVREQDELELGRTMLRARALVASLEPDLRLRDGRLDFNRPPRVRKPPEPLERELPPPPSPGRKARLPLAASLLPLAAGLLLFFLLDSPVMLAIAGLSPLMAIGSYLGDRRGGRRTFAKASEEFREHVAAAIAELDRGLAGETAERRAELPDAGSLIAGVRELAPTLWERRPDDSDFLVLRVGVADLPARCSVTIGRGGDAELRAEAEAQLAERALVPSVPVPVELTKVGAVGLTGDERATAGLARWMVAQAAILHSPDDLIIAAALAEEAAAEWQWLKWLPHLRLDRLGLLIPPVAVGREAATEMLSELSEMLRLRAERRRVGESGTRGQARVMLLLDERLGIDRSLLRAVLSDAAELGVAAIWLGRDVRDLPGQVGAIVQTAADRAVLDLTDVDSGTRVEDVSADSLSLDLALEASRLLAPLRDVSERGRSADIPRRAGLLEILSLLPPSAAALRERWEASAGALRAVVGVGAEGPLSVDLRTEGPHALIAGTTGSGKSELLRTFVASAAATLPPDRLAFLLVDYKGGAAFAPCAALPHVVDVVSDLDEHMAERALVSLEAELKRRERTLADHGAKDLVELQRRHPDAAPPVLVIAVDEFAKLREEIPEFVDGVVDIAQRGRSLGVHMVLAAQTLRNAFTPAIRANTNLRIALRVADDAESEDVIGSPLAGRIPSGEGSLGRAFVRTGSGDAELRELQTAYVSGRSAADEGLELRVLPFGLTDLGQLIGSGPDSADSDADNDLTALAEAARQAQAEIGLTSPPPPWLPMLPDVLGLDQLEPAEAAPGAAALGVVDVPQLQQQVPLTVDLESAGHVAVFGSGGSGKTTFLTSTALALAGTADPERLCIYGLDAGGGHLAPLAGLPHCGAVVSVEDEERVERLFRELLGRIDRRVAARRVAGEASSAADGQLTVLLLDDVGSFAQQYDRPGSGSAYESLQRVLSSGRNASVHVVLSASRRGDLPAALAAHVGGRFVLRLPTEDDMRGLGLDAKAIRGAKLPPGRGFTQDSQEFQVAVPVEGEEPLALAEAVTRLPGDGSVAVRPIEVLPGRVGRDSLGRAESVAALPLGVGEADLGVTTVDLSEMHLLVAGPYRSGRSTALATIATGVREAEPRAALHLLAPRRSPLRELGFWDSVATSAEACAGKIESLLREAEDGTLESRPTFLVIDDGGELAEATVISNLERLVRVGRDSRLRVIASVESAAARGIGVGWIRELRREGHGLLLQPDLAAEGDLLGARLPRRVAAPLVPGRGFLVRSGEAELVQVAG